ncbi:hypothetical protein [Bordetella tumulicola]|uniref:hypothetical protein n=1 Tax=Bordetella tumulicola TaxID=1649133 RepID=UPI0039F14A6A
MARLQWDCAGLKTALDAQGIAASAAELRALAKTLARLQPRVDDQDFSPTVAQGYPASDVSTDVSTAGPSCLPSSNL